MPGYDAATRGVREPITYDPKGQSVIFFEGSFSGHRTIRALLDFVIFVDVPVELQRARFAAFYRWKGFNADAIEDLWRERAADEWPTVDQQRGTADLIVTLGAKDS